jgi:hypothetical protein
MIGFRLVIAVVLAFAGYQWATSFERKRGQRAWGLPPLVWALLFGLGLLIGLVCAVIAERGAKNAAARPEVAWQPLPPQLQASPPPQTGLQGEPWAAPQGAPVAPQPPSA